MIRCRFYVPNDDPRPVVWPIKHPYWVTGATLDGTCVLVAYADDEAEIMRNWPDARDLDSTSAKEYVFTDRFRKPAWFQSPTDPKP